MAGSISALTVPGDYWLFHYLIDDVRSFVFTMAIAAAIVMLFATIGVELAVFKTHRDRMRRGIHAFAGAWRQA